MPSATVTDRELDGAIARWTGSGISELAHHNRACCRDAVNWFRAMDRAASRVRGAPVVPAWILRRWKWGPSGWPMYWCRAVVAKELDCGALAALAADGLRNRGVLTSRAQILRAYSAEDCDQWRTVWSSHGGVTAWLSESLAYHEVVAIPADDLRSVRLWDPSEGRWVERSDEPGYGVTVAVRMLSQEGAPDAIDWDGLRLPADRWVSLTLREHEAAPVD